jgi:hypothetical protein
MEASIEAMGEGWVALSLAGFGVVSSPAPDKR